jgi:hypothetical protein
MGQENKLLLFFFSDNTEFTFNKKNGIKKIYTFWLQTFFVDFIGALGQEMVHASLHFNLNTEEIKKVKNSTDLKSCTKIALFKKVCAIFRSMIWKIILL